MVAAPAKRERFVIGCVDADPEWYGHCECGCGTSLHNTPHVAAVGRYAWHAVNVKHAVRIVKRVSRHPFELVGTSTVVA